MGQFDRINRGYMELKGIKFRAIMATPGLGKSYLGDNYEEFVDCDEVRLFCKYVIPKEITREELELTKCRRPFEKRQNWEELLEKELQEHLKNGKILIFAPHSQSREFLIRNKISYLFVYPKKNMKKQIKQRMIERGNCQEVVKENDDLFDDYYFKNNLEAFASVKYRVKKNQYLSDVLALAGVDFDKLTPKKSKIQ